MFGPLFKLRVEPLRLGPILRKVKVSIPVVANLYQRTNSPIIAFSCLNILGAAQGQKTVTVQLTRGCTLSGGGGGTDFGARTPPRLAQ